MPSATVVDLGHASKQRAWVPALAAYSRSIIDLEYAPISRARGSYFPAFITHRWRAMRMDERKGLRHMPLLECWSSHQHPFPPSPDSQLPPKTSSPFVVAAGNR